MPDTSVDVERSFFTLLNDRRESRMENNTGNPPFGLSRMQEDK